MTFNEKIDKYMKDNNIDNIKQLATSAGIPYTTLRDFYEKQSADNSRLSTIRKLSNYMNCSMDYLAYDNITEMNQIKLDGLDLDFNIDNPDKIWMTKTKLNLSKEQLDMLTQFLKDNHFNYEIIQPSKIDKASTEPDELDILYSKAKQHLSDDDIENIKFIYNKTIKNYEESKNKNNND